MSVNKITPNLHRLFCCEICDFNCVKSSDYTRHILTAKHKNNEARQCLSIKSADILHTNYSCDNCHYNTCNKFDYDKHLSTDKHLVNVLHQNRKKSQTYICSGCNCEYALYNSYYKHKKRCQVLENKNELTNERREPDMKKPEITIDFVLDLMKQNKDLQNCLMESHTKIVELSQNSGVVNNNNTTNNNQQFNLQVFLNETCKDAMNITDFVNSLQLTTQDFENTGKLGFVEGITQIIINSLNGVDTTKRPVHCTDSKRETIYIKDDNVWEKEDDNKTKFKQVVKQVANKNLQQLSKWKQENPDCITLDSKENIEYRKYYKAALGGNSNEEDDKFFEKIKRNVLKEIVVDKSI